ncbi:hypothetical protein TUM12370_07330 [Salmonella enterica subsp. enterica serovar Choleraesuis]|nr:hypothetical protein TUM12370_07330 [Salmonella enterica subsp. enterica serovar Choleraesuis]
MFTERGIFHQGSNRIAVLLIHGLTGTPKEMDSVALRLHRYGFSVSIPVLAGHCSTIESLMATNRTSWLASVEQEYLRLKDLGYKVFVGGLSAGASMSILTASKFPEIAGLALYSTTLRTDGWSVSRFGRFLPLLLKIPFFRNGYRFKEAYPYGIKNEPLRERIVMKLDSGDSSAAGHTSTPGMILYEMLEMADMAKEVMANVKAPALIVHAEEDDLASVNNARYVEQHYGGRSELLLLKDSYHLVTIDQERQLVADATARFFFSCLNAEEQQMVQAAAKKAIPQPK